MIKKIKEIINQYIWQVRHIKELSDYIVQVKTENYQLRQLLDDLNKLSQEEKVIEKIIRRGIEWYDWKELNEAERKTYEQNALNILRNNVFQNEINHTVADLVKEIALKSQNWEEVKDLRMTINGIELLRERLSDVSEPKEREKTFNNLDDVI